MADMMPPSPAPYYIDSTVTLHHGDCLDVLRALPDASVDAVCTDPPYGLEFMGKEWDGADGFRRSLNPNDVGRDNAFGRTSKTSPEYRTASKATATRRQEGGISQATGPSFLGGLNPKCLVCDHWQRGSNPCRCDAPKWTQERLVRLHSFQEWCEAWSRECLRVLKPGGHMLAFGGTRTFHRLACAVEDAGFEVRDSIAWLYGSGFPKSLDVSKAIDKAARGVPQGSSDPTSPNHGRYRTTTTEGKRWDGDSGQGYGAGGSRFLADGMASGSATERVASGAAAVVSEAVDWQGWGTALKPAFEPIVVARKPLAGTVAANVLAHGTGALNVDGCRVGTSGATTRGANGSNAGKARNTLHGGNFGIEQIDAGRWPANAVLDESQAAELDAQSGILTSGANPTRRGSDKFRDAYGEFAGQESCEAARGADSGGASRFFYVAKADQSERVRVDGIAHPTVKPLDLMRWLVRLVTPPGGTVLEPFAGSGTTVEACILEGFQCIAIEREADYLPLIVQRINRRRDPVAAIKATGDDGGLFDLLGEASA